MQLAIGNNMHKILYELRNVCKDLKIFGDKELLDKALCAYAAASNSDHSNVGLSYTYIMRKLRKNSPEKINKFQTSFKKTFDKALDEGLENPVEIALMTAVKAINWTENA